MQGIDQSRLPQVGVLVITSVLYMLIGLVFGYIVRTVTKIPQGWRYGVLAAGAFSNWGDLPLVLIGTIVSTAPFNGAIDEAKGLSYVAVYIFVQTTVLFPMNGIWLVGRDFKPAENELTHVTSAGIMEIGESHALVSKATLRSTIISFAWKLVSPPSLATLIGFVVAVVPQLRALFVSDMDWTYPTAPDGSPPLDFLIDVMDFIGAGSVPSSLLILGYSLSRLKLSKMPVLKGAILMAILKMAVLPIIAICWTQLLATHTSLVAKEDLVLRLVMILPSAVPTATSLLYITQILAPAGREEGIECLSVFLVIQYALLGITLSITVVYTLNLIT